MATLNIARGLHLPLDFITMRSLLLGVSGSGKSTFARLLAELVHEAGQRFCVVDPKGDWWGLKSSADGQSAAIPVVIIGGKRADIPLDPDAGSAVADIVVELPHSFVLDLSTLSKGRAIRFVGQFFTQLYHRNEEPLLLFLDEADLYAPQKTMSPEQNVTLGAADDIARRGRGKGIGSVWISQRPAVINKNATSQCEIITTFRTNAKLDLKELREHLGRVTTPEQFDEVFATVPGLNNGQGIIISQHPDTKMFATVQFPMPKTFDSSATPKVGKRRAVPKKLAVVDLAAMGERIKSTIEKAKAEDPRVLKLRIAELEKGLAARPDQEFDVEGLEAAAEARGHAEGLVEGSVGLDVIKREAYQEGFGDARAQYDDKLKRIGQIVENIAGEAVVPRAMAPLSLTTPRHRLETARAAVEALKDQKIRPVRVSRETEQRLTAAAGDLTITPAKQRILDALRYLETMGVSDANRSQLALMADASPRAGYFNNNVGELKTAELLEYPAAGLVRLTSKGRALANATTAPKNNAELHALVMQKLTPAKQKILAALIKFYPSPLSREELAAQVEASPRAGYFNNNVGELKTMGVVDYPRSGQVVAEPILFLKRA